MNQLPASGDPFSLAYAKNGLAPPRLPQPILPPDSGCAPPSPPDALVDCLRSMQSILGDTLQLTDFAPWIHPPYRSRYLCYDSRAVISTTVAYNAPTNAAGIVLAAANSTFVPCPLLEMRGASDWQTIFTFDVPESHIARFKSWGISNENGPPEQIDVSVMAGTVGGEPEPPNPTISSYEVPNHQPTFFLVQDSQELQVRVVLRDPTQGPALVKFGVCLWTFPVTKRTDSREDARLRDVGFGLDCL